MREFPDDLLGRAATIGHDVHGLDLAGVTRPDGRSFHVGDPGQPEFQLSEPAAVQSHSLYPQNVVRRMRNQSAY
jgi:hypothetical protein